MKKLPIININEEASELILRDINDSEIWKTSADQYALRVDWKKKPIHAFSSPEFTALLLAIEREILYFTVTENVCMMCPCGTKMIEICLLVQGGDVYHVSWNGAISRATVV